jgi:hypothetical protein
MSEVHVLRAFALAFTATSALYSVGERLQGLRTTPLSSIDRPSSCGHNASPTPRAPTVPGTHPRWQFYTLAMLLQRTEQIGYLKFI